MNLQRQRLAMLGFGVENRGLGAWLAAQGLTFSVCDTNAAARRDHAPWHSAVGEWRLGEGALANLSDFDVLFRSPGIPVRSAELVAAQRAGVSLSSAIDLFLQLCPVAVVGVTGTKGKGTTASMLSALLDAAGIPVRLGGNIGTSPLSFLDELVPADRVILELSSFQLQDLGRSPAGAVLLPVATDHLDYHRTRAEYVEAKGEICRHQDAAGWVLAAAGCPTAGELAAQSRGRSLSFSGTTAITGDGCWAEDGQIHWRCGATHVVVARTSALRIPGAHNLDNACAAVAAAMLLGAPAETVTAGLQAFDGLPHRLEIVGEYDGVLYVNDSLATTPEAAVAGLRAWAPRPVLLIAGGSSKGADFSRLGEAITAGATALMTLGQEGPRIAQAARQAGYDGAVREDCPTMAAAVEAATAMAQPGSVVLLSPACASFGMFTSYAERGEAFRQAVPAGRNGQD